MGCATCCTASTRGGSPRRSTRADPAARRRHPRRQPALGQASGGAEPASGHRAGADKIAELLGWCEEVGVEVVTLWLLSTDNLNRPGARARRRCWRSSRTLVDDLADDRPLAGPPGRRAGPAARPTPPGALKDAADAHRRRRRACTSTSPSATAAGARSPTRCASLLQRARRPRAPRIEELAEVLDVEHIAEHLYTKGQPDPDLVIRTSGEQRLGGLPALAERALASSTSARPTGRTSARSTSCARCAPTPRGDRRFGG